MAMLLLKIASRVDLFKYEISFDVESCGGYSSDGIFPVTLKNYSIHEIRET